MTDTTDLREALKRAYVEGATDVHNHWTANPGEAQRGDPEFAEAGSDYAAMVHDQLGRAIICPDELRQRFKDAEAVTNWPTIWRDPAGKGYPCFEDRMTIAEIIAHMRSLEDKLDAAEAGQAVLKDALERIAATDEQVGLAIGAPAKCATIARAALHAIDTTERAMTVDQAQASNNAR